MRNGIRLLFVSLLVVGCATTQPAAAPAQSNGQKIRALYDAFARRDIPTVLASFDPQIEWWEAESTSFADHNPYRGPQAILEGVFMRLPERWNDFRLNIQDVIDGGDSVAIVGRYTGTSKSTGQPLDAQFVHVWKIRNGKVVKFQQFADTAQLERVAGAMH